MTTGIQPLRLLIFPKMSKGQALNTIRVDIAIVGGGIQGLMLLDNFNRRDDAPSVLLVEHDLLACKQTGHAQGFLMEGHSFPGPSNANSDFHWSNDNRELLLRSKQCWEDLKERFPTSFDQGVSYLFDSEERARHQKVLLRSRGLEFFTRGRTSFETGETFVNQQDLIEKLYAEYEHQFLFGTTAIEGSPAKPSLLVSNANQSLRVRPQKVIFATGAAELDFEQSDSWDAFRFAKDDRSKRTTIVAVSAKGDRSLPEIHVYIPEKAAMVVSRKSRGETVWLVQLQRKSNGDFHDSAKNRAAEIISFISPEHVSIEECNLNIHEFSVDSGPKSGVKRLPGGRYVDIDNALQVWPGRLTYSPVIAEEISSMLNASSDKQFDSESLPIDFQKPSHSVAPPPW